MFEPWIVPVMQAEPAAAGRKLRALIPPMSPKVIFRALLGVLLFFCGIVFGVWLIIRFRRHVQHTEP